MNEKYQQALDNVKKLLENIHEASIEYIRGVSDDYKTLQELVDMMKPLEFEEIKELHEYVIVSKAGIIKSAYVVFKYTDEEGMKRFIIANDSWKWSFDNFKFYRNIWEVE